MGVTIGTFVVTGAIAACIMFVLMRLVPPVLTPWQNIPAEELGEYASISQMIVNFFTAEDFVSLLSRKAMLPLIVFSCSSASPSTSNGGKDTVVGKWLDDLAT